MREVNSNKGAWFTFPQGNRFSWSLEPIKQSVARPVGLTDEQARLLARLGVRVRDRISFSL